MSSFDIYQKYHTHGRIVFTQALRNVRNDTTYEHTINVIKTQITFFFFGSIPSGIFNQLWTVESLAV